MKSVSAMTMRRQFGGLLDKVRRESEPVIIERAGKPVAMLSPLDSATPATSQARQMDALERLCGMGG